MMESLGIGYGPFQGRTAEGTWPGASAGTAAGTASALGERQRLAPEVEARLVSAVESPVPRRSLSDRFTGALRRMLRLGRWPGGREVAIAGKPR